MPTIELGLFDIQQIDPLDSADAQTRFARRLDDLALADSLGLDLAFVAERHYLSTYWCQSATVWTAAATQRTATIRLGTLAYTLPIISPVRLAEEIATLDQISGGRIEFGVGLGHRIEELEANVVDASQRIDIFQERLAILEGLWSGGVVTYDGEHTKVKDARLNPVPLQQPYPPLWFAGTDPASAMWAAQHGMNLAIGFSPDDQLFGATAAFRHGLATRRTRVQDTDSIRRGSIALMRHVYLAETDDLAKEDMIEDLIRLGELDENATESNRSERRTQAAERQAHLIEKNVYVAGAPESVANQILNARNTLGANVFLANVYAAGIDQARVQRTIRLLATDVRETLDSLQTRL